VDLTLLIGSVALLLIIVALQISVVRRLRTATDSSIAPRLDGFERLLERSERGVREEVAGNREEIARRTQEQREELSRALQTFAETMQGQVSSLGAAHQGLFDSFAQQLQTATAGTEERLDRSRQSVDARLLEVAATVDAKLTQISLDNERRLEQMRATVEEKLQGALEQKLGESFRTVQTQLEQVYKGLGEMQALAAGVGDLKRVLANVKTRGTWGEVQLGALLEQALTTEQYATNVATRRGSSERVEYAIKLPGRDAGGDDQVWMPIDAKFPVEDYQRLQDAAERADIPAVELAGRALEQRVLASAQEIRDKYLDPPHTTDFALLFLPTEGLYAEVLRRPGLAEQVQRLYRVVLAGPTTLLALLNSLQMGFRTLAIEQRSSEVWRVLGAVKTEFGKFGDVLGKLQKKLQEASNVVDDAARRSRAIDRKLREVEALPLAEAQVTLPADANPAEDDT